jgi:hypothetical protein
VLGQDQRIIAAVVLVCFIATGLAACGGVSSTENAETRLAAAFDIVHCDARTLSAQTEQKERANFRLIVKADRKLPRVAKLISDAQGEDQLQAAIRKAAEAPGYKPASLRNDFAAIYRLRVKFYADEKALGFRCISPPQRPSEG